METLKINKQILKINKNTALEIYFRLMNLTHIFRTFNPIAAEQMFSNTYGTFFRINHVLCKFTKQVR